MKHEIGLNVDDAASLPEDVPRRDEYAVQATLPVATGRALRGQVPWLANHSKSFGTLSNRSDS
jgi:hypothetical protein